MKKITKVILSTMTASALIGGAYAATNSAAQSAPTATAQPQMSDAQVMEAASYIIGYSIAQNITNELQSQNINLNTDQVLQGFDTGITGGQPRLTDEQMQQALVQFQQQAQSQASASTTPAAPANTNQAQ